MNQIPEARAPAQLHNPSWPHWLVLLGRTPHTDHHKTQAAPETRRQHTPYYAGVVHATARQRLKGLGLAAPALRNRRTRRRWHRHRRPSPQTAAACERCSTLRGALWRQRPSLPGVDQLAREAGRGALFDFFLFKASLSTTSSAHRTACRACTRHACTAWPGQVSAQVMPAQRRTFFFRLGTSRSVSTSASAQQPRELSGKRKPQRQ